MSTENSDQEKSKIVTDEDWKQRVKSEDAALDEQIKVERAEAQDQSRKEDSAKEAPNEPPPADVDPQSADSSTAPPPLPPASLSTMIGMLSTQAMLSLGMFPNPSTGKTNIQPETARHFIDLLGVLEEKTKNNVDSNEQSLLEQALHELRVIYVEQTKQQNSDGA